MDATTKVLLDEMKKMSDHIDSRLNAIEGRLEGLERHGDAADSCIKPLEEKAEEIAVW
jgi:DNA-binding FrmR family transcriptional regulator